MTYQPETTSERLTFERALDALPCHKSDVIVVLRCHDAEENKERVELAAKLLTSGWANVMLLFNDSANTKDEAHKLREMLLEMMWKRVILVTHSYHSYRAYLTFVKWLADLQTEIYIKTVPSGVVLGEREKIDKYSAAGDCATYSEGMDYIGRDYIKWLTTNRT